MITVCKYLFISYSLRRTKTSDQKAKKKNIKAEMEEPVDEVVSTMFYLVPKQLNHQQMHVFLNGNALLM